MLGIRRRTGITMDATAAELIAEDEEWEAIQAEMDEGPDDAYWEALTDHYASMDYEPSPYDGTYSEM